MSGAASQCDMFDYKPQMEKFRGQEIPASVIGDRRFSTMTANVKQKLVRSIVTLCTELGIQLVAEGIETPEERDALVALGGDLCQGYLFAKPGRGFPEPKMT